MQRREFIKAERLIRKSGALVGLRDVVPIADDNLTIIGIPAN